MDIAVRAAVVENAGSIARVQIQAWRETYAHLLPAKALARLQQGPRDVLASHYGSGAGQQLLDAAVGDGGAYLWIADENPRALAF